MNPTNTGGTENKLLLKELRDFRNMLLIYRLIHFKDDIPDIDIGVVGRDKELIKPTLQLFQNTKSKGSANTLPLRPSSISKKPEERSSLEAHFF